MAGLEGSGGPEGGGSYVGSADGAVRPEGVCPHPGTSWATSLKRLDVRCKQRPWEVAGVNSCLQFPG